MSDRRNSDVLIDIQEAVRRVRTYTDEMTYDIFLSDKKTQDAVIRNLEIIGEAARNLTVNLREKYPDVPWKGMYGVRNRLIHHYFGVNLDIVWNIATIELSALESQVEEMLQQESK